jgi:hypothetical protein
VKKGDDPFPRPVPDSAHSVKMMTNGEVSAEDMNAGYTELELHEDVKGVIDFVGAPFGVDKFFFRKSYVSLHDEGMNV